MKKIFISQPMRGKTDEEIIKERQEAIDRAKKVIGEEVVVLETFFTDFDGKSPLSYLAQSLHYLAQADVAMFVGDWKNYRGCRIEHLCATEYGIDRIE